MIADTAQLKRRIKEYAMATVRWRESSRPRNSQEYQELRENVDRLKAEIDNFIDKLTMLSDIRNDEPSSRPAFQYTYVDNVLQEIGTDRSMFRDSLHGVRFIGDSETSDVEL